jgi:hypothetical protein
VAPLDDAGNSIERLQQSLPVYLNNIHYIFLIMIIMRLASGDILVFSFVFLLLGCISRVYNPVIRFL